MDLEILKACLATYDKSAMLCLMRRGFHHLVELNIETSFPVTDKGFAALSGGNVAKVEEAIATYFGGTTFSQLQGWKKNNPPHYRREILRYGCAFLPDVRQRTGLTPDNPPETIHSMIRQEIFVGDLYSSDMMAAAIERAGLKFLPGRRYLDFGCSSGPVVRTMAATFPQSIWFGCDPVRTSIEWAKATFPNISFETSPQNPPLSYEDGYFNGIYAVSIWSHFSESAALRWFGEMARIIDHGGFLVLTTHGYRSAYYYLERDLFDPLTISQILACLIVDRFCFRVAWDENNPDPDGLDISEWGNAFFTLQWLLGNISESWHLADYAPGLNQGNQDTYVLVRR